MEKFNVIRGECISSLRHNTKETRMKFAGPLYALGFRIKLKFIL